MVEHRAYTAGCSGYSMSSATEAQWSVALPCRCRGVGYFQISQQLTYTPHFANSLQHFAVTELISPRLSPRFDDAIMISPSGGYSSKVHWLSIGVTALETLSMAWDGFNSFRMEGFEALELQKAPYPSYLFIRYLSHTHTYYLPRAKLPH